MSIFAIAITSFIVAFSGAISPGPLLAVTINRSLANGAKAGPLLITGHSILELLLVVLLVAGLGRYIRDPVFINLFSIMGGGILIWMAFNTIQPFVNVGQLEIHQKNRGGFISSGIFVSLANPYWIIWWATIGLTYLSLAAPRGFAGFAAFFIGHISADFLWYSIVSFSIGKGKYKITPLIYRCISAFCAVFLAVFGALFILKGMIYNMAIVSVE